MLVDFYNELLFLLSLMGFGDMNIFSGVDQLLEDDMESLLFVFFLFRMLFFIVESLESMVDGLQFMNVMQLKFCLFYLVLDD